MKLLMLGVLATALCCAQEHTPPPKQSPPPAEQKRDAQHQPAAQGASGTEHAQQAAAHGEGHDSGRIHNEMLWKWVNFAILFTLLAWLARKHAGPYFAARAEGIRHGIEDAKRMKAEADARAAEIERRIGNLSADIEALRKSSHEEIAAEGARVRAETEQQLAKIQAQGEAEIAAAAKTASQQLKAHAAELALKLAEDQLRGRLTAQDQNGLVRSFVRDLEPQSGNGGSAR